MGNFVFNNCSKKTERALQLFCDNINECDSDIFIVMAQKALCLYDFLVNLGLVEKKNVFSSNSIDFNKDLLDWSDKQVVILEDIIVSGSALSAATNRLKNFGVTSSNLKIIAIARDIEYQNMRFTNEDTNENILVCGMNCSDSDCIELSYDISRLLSYYGIPYDTDYPLYPKIQLDNRAIKKLYHSPLWDTYDVANVENEKNKIKVLTLFPTKIAQNNIWDLINIRLDSHVHLKCRIYLNENNNLTIVPMALFNEIKDSDVLSLYSYFKARFFPDFNLGENWTTKTKFRFIQYYIAHKFSQIICNELIKEKDLMPRKEWLIIQFGPAANDIYKVIAQKGNYNVAFTENTIEVLKPNTFLFGASKIDDSIGNYSQVEVNELLLSPFRERHFKEEIPTRERIKKLNAHFTKDYQIIDKYSNRLRRGFSLNALVEIFSKTIHDFDCEKMISLFLDRAIDFGIVVPITYHNYSKGYICRAYRHGEDLPFGEADKYRVVYFLRCLKDYFWLYNVDDRPATITLEKMIVLFLQMGLNHGEIFNRFLGFENYPVLKERFCIHGAIATFFDDKNKDIDHHMYTELETSTWVTTWLKDIGLITKKKGLEGFYYILNDGRINDYINKNNCGNLSKEIQIVIESIADIIANWYSLYKNKKKKFKDDITALTSCYNRYTFTSAIITEIHFFKRYWDNQVKKNLSIIDADSWDDKQHSFFYNDIEQGLNSGRDKYKWYLDCRAQQVINKVALKLKASRNPHFSLWKQCTNDIDEIPITEIDEKLAEALGFLYFYSACYEWLVKGNLLNFDNGENFLIENNAATKYFEEFKELTKKSHRLKPDLFSIFENISHISSLYKRTNELNSAMTKIIEYSEKLIGEIEIDIAKNSKAFTVFYESCFIIDIRTKTNINNTLMELWASLDEDIYKTELNIIDFGMIDDSYQRFGVFYSKNLADQSISNFYLYNVFEKLRSLLVEKSYATRCVFIPNIPPQVVMMHNTQEHINKYKQDFSDSILNYIVPYFEDEFLHQLIIVESGKNNSFDITIMKSFYSQEKELGQIDKIVLPDKLFAKILFSYDERENLDCCNYSTVGIFDGIDDNSNIQGTGFLILYKEDIFCVTCQHLFESYSLEKTYIKFKKSKTKYEVQFLNHHNKPTGQNEPAINDVLIMKIEKNALSKIDRDKLFSCSTLISAKEAVQTKFSMFGYSSSTGSILNSIQFMGECDNDYYLLHSEEGKAQKGFSGASVVSEKGDFLGMHSWHNNNDMFVIPADQILKEIKKIK